MAENIYSKGTRVWFEDKDQAWISAEVLSVFKGAGDAIKLVFIDERGKVVVLSDMLSLSSQLPFLPGNYHQHYWEGYQR
jgi:hypothetical protein